MKGERGEKRRGSVPEIAFSIALAQGKVANVEMAGVAFLAALAWGKMATVKMTGEAFAPALAHTGGWLPSNRRE